MLRLRSLGQLIWRQSRDISVWNYSQAIVYEIYTNQGTLFIRQNKDNGSVDVLDDKQVQRKAINQNGQQWELK